jgi:hypothetical protein
MKAIGALLLLTACIGDAARITSEDGETISAEVISYQDGMFKIRKDGKVYDFPIEKLDNIKFEFAKEQSNVRVDIKRISTNISKSERGYRRYYINPSVQIDCRNYVHSVKQRPILLLRLNIQESKSGVIKELVLWYDWEKDRGWSEISSKDPCDPEKVSEEQPQCDWKNLSPITLAEGSSGYSKSIMFEVKPKVLAARAEIWFNGLLVASETKNNDYHFPVPASWK